MAIGQEGLSILFGQQVTNPTVNALRYTAIDSESYVAQAPVATNTPLQVTFGVAQSSAYATLAADGTITLLQTGYYQFRVRMSVGRDTNVGVSNLLARLLVNGSQVGPTQSVKLNGVQFTLPLEFTFDIQLAAGTVIAFEIMRDSSGANDGGIQPFDPTLAGWNLAASSDLLIHFWTGVANG